MQSGLWDNIPQELLADVEAQMYDCAREQLAIYVRETA
jgi:hypothetical protein